MPDINDLTDLDGILFYFENGDNITDYQINELRFGEAVAAGVPESSTYALVIARLLGIGMIRRKQGRFYIVFISSAVRFSKYCSESLRCQFQSLPKIVLP